MVDAAACITPAITPKRDSGTVNQGEKRDDGHNTNGDRCRMDCRLDAAAAGFKMLRRSASAPHTVAVLASPLWLKRPMPRHKASSKTASGTLASRADKYDLYIKSVQSPEVEVSFCNRVFRNHYGRPPLVLREDFCGTALVCYEWVKSRADRVAIGVDLDPEPLQWGRRKLMPTLRSDAARRLHLIEGDVRTTRAKADVICAQNFSYFCFETRAELRDYFAHARRHLGSDGLLVLDALGGSEVMEDERQEVTSFRGFKYVWHQVDFDPVSHHCKYAIHFRFKDGSQLKNAFRYEWRLWTLPELRELLLEAGFAGVDVYWEGTDRKTGDGNGVYRRRTRGDADPAWVVYLVAWK